jgi:diguanylate cyclase (GGDEF)-like protein
LSTMIERLAEKELLAVFEIDLDNFGVINKKLSHSHGDEAIRTHCLIVKQTLGSVGEIYRRGGDEVVVMAPGISEEMARVLAEKTRAQVQEAFRRWALQHSLDPPPTASIGITLARCGEDALEVIRRVDEAQQQAKQQGKNRVILIQ